MAEYYTILGAGFRRAGETVHQMSNPWAFQTTVSFEADALLQVRERIALPREVRRAGLLLRKLQWPPLGGLQWLPRNAAMHRARDELKLKASPPAQPAPTAVDNCWSRDRAEPSSLSTAWNSSVVRGSSSEGRHGHQGAQQPHQPTPGTEIPGSGERPRRKNLVCGRRPL